MECTQRLECTQELYDTQSERICPEQVGFLGICGSKFPVVKGPNKIGRDPQTCSIVLNLNSVSRQHAVINVLNSREYMLMDLDSANKTKLLNKILQPYIPHPLRDGDTVQFGDVFGIFRLLEDNNELPMTQALDIPETPLPSKHVSKLHKAPTTMIPESPDVSDRDDSYTTPSHSKSSKLSNESFIKPSNTILIHSVKSFKTDNSRISSKQSTSKSINDDPNTSLNESFISLKVDKNVSDSIYDMNTQAPDPIVNESTDSIYTADTQIPAAHVPSPSIHSLDTQLPTITENLPQVRKISNQHEMQFDIYAANKENNKDIFNADTQQFAYEKHDSIVNISKHKSILSDFPKVESKENINTSEEELLFDEVDGECFEEDFNSQNILPDQLPLEDRRENKEKDLIPSIRDNRIQSDGSTDCEDIIPTQKVIELPTNENKQDTEKEKVHTKINVKPLKRLNRIKSDSSTDCEDIDMIPTQKIPELASNKDTKKEKVHTKINVKPVKRINGIQSDSSTDCEDIDMIPTQKIPEKKNDDEDVTDCEDDIIQIIPNKPNETKVGVTKFEDMPTQVIDVDHNKEDKIAFEDMLTQVIDVDETAIKSKEVAFEDQPTQVIEVIEEVVEKNTNSVKVSLHDIVSPFKIPLQSPIRVKSKDIPKLTPKDKSAKSKPGATTDDHNYYDNTQDIYEDLSSQRETSPDILVVAHNADDEVVPCSVEGYKTAEKFANIDKELSTGKKHDDEQVTEFVAILSSQDVREVIGVNAQVAKLKKVPSDSSDVESTPKKFRPFLFTDSDLPSSQEIKTSVMSHVRSAVVTESSSESELEDNTENNSESQNTPFLHRKKKIKPAAKIDLTKKFEIEKLPERVITRQRKPTSKLQESAEINKKFAASMLKPTYWMGEDGIDGDIITENIKRLKTYEKCKNKDSKNETIKEDKKEIEIKKENDVKKESTTQNKTKNKSSEPKEKFKVKIEKPKRKDTKSKKESSIRKSDTVDNRSKEDTLDSTSTSRTSSRRTRSKKQEDDSRTTEIKSVSPETKKEPDNKRKRTKDKREKSKSPEVVEVRRSKRQQKVKEKKDEDTMKAPKSILKKSMHEQSTVYNISDSSTESPKSLKRSLVDDNDMPVPKRTRGAANSSHTTNNSSINNVSLRATPARAQKTHHVLLTAFPSDEVKQKLEKLGAVMVSDVLECSVVLTIQIKRTFKLLCAVGLGRPIVGPNWVQACVDTHMIVDPWLYLVKDESAEKRFQFNLERTLTGKRSFLKGCCVSSTPSVQPNTSEMKLIVECSGGTWKEGGSNWVCVSCTKDKELWPALRKRGATVVSTEFILGGVLRQKLDIATNKF